jgi:hypothetical protein
MVIQTLQKRDSILINQDKKAAMDALVGHICFPQSNATNQINKPLGTYKQAKQPKWYRSLHEWVNRRLKKPKTCPGCNQERKLEACNVSGEYKKNLSDWKYLCRKCHMIEDGRKEKSVKRMSIVNVSHDKIRDNSGRFIAHAIRD